MTRSIGLVAATFSGVLACATTVSAGVNSFTRTGPDGGIIHAIAVRPNFPDTVLAASARGIHVSADNGMNWTLAPASPAILNAPTALAFDPGTPGRAWAVAGAVFRSIDSGSTFAAVTGEPSDLQHLAVSGTHVYAASYAGRIIRSDDGGQNWTTLNVPWPASATLYSIAAAPGNSGVLYACIFEQNTNHGIYKSVNSGTNWTGPIAASPCSSQSKISRGLSVSPVDANRVLAPTSDGMFLSTNGGATWTMPLALSYNRWAAFDPAAPDNVLTVEASGLVQRSADGGGSWPPSLNGTHLRQYEVFAGAYVGVAGRVWVGTPDGPMYSSDNGSSFVLRNRGIGASEVRDVIASDDGTVYAVQRSGPVGLWRRGPATWAALDNAELGTLTAGPLAPMAIATAAEDSSLLFMGDHGGGLFRSNNGGADWLPSPPSVATQLFTLAVDPTNPLIAYGGKASGGMLKTIDGGQSFTPCGSFAVPVYGLRVDRASPNIVYAIGGYSPDGRLYKSTDRCVSWAAVTPAFILPLNDIAIDPVDHQKLWIANNTGVQRSRDGGASWEPVHFGLAHGDIVLAYRVLLDPILPSTMWVINGDFGGLARSVDDGVTWQKADIPFTGGAIYLTSGVLDPLHPDTLVAGVTNYGLVEYQVATDLQIGIATTGTLYASESTASATIQVRNNGPWHSSSAEVVIGLPGLLDAPTPAGCTRSGSNLRCTITRLRVGQNVDIPLSLQFGPAAGAGALTATIAGHEADQTMSNNTATQQLSSQRMIDLQVDAAVSQRVVENHTLVHFTVTASNRGTTPARGTSVTLDFRSFNVSGIQSTAGPCSIVGPIGICPLGNLLGTGGHTLEFDAFVNAVGDVPMQATLREESGEFSAQDSANVLSSAVGDVSVGVTDSADPVAVGTPYQYTVTVNNVTGDTTYVLLDATVTGATVSAATTTGGTCTTAATTVHCDLIIIPAGGSTPVTITVSGSAGGTASISAVATHPGRDTVAGNNTATTSTVISGGSSGSSSGGGGGGGRFDWLAAGLLGLLLARRKLVQ